MANDTLTSGSIHFSGLATGTDFDSLVTQLVDLESVNKKRLERWKASWETKITSFQELNTSLLGLKTSLDSINRTSSFLIKNAATTDGAVATATASAEALEGNHTLITTQLAQNHVLYSDNNATNPIPDPAVTDITGGAAKVFAYSYAGGTVKTLNLAPGTTLQGLANAINKDPNNPGVRAEVLKIGDNDYRLKMVGLDQGQTKSIVIDGATTLTGFATGTWTQAQPPQNAAFSIDGINFTRSTNAVTDAVTGLSLNLVDEGTTQISVTTDTEAIKENIRNFVLKVNEVRAKIQSLTQFDDQAQQGSILTGNYGVQIIAQNLKDIVSSRGIGFDPTSDAFHVLSQLGITTDANESSPTKGQLLLDEEKLDEALSKDMDGVAELFSAYYDGVSTSADFMYSSSLGGTTKPGSYKIAYTVGAGPTITGVTINGNPADASYDSATGIWEITGRSGKPESGLAVRVTNLTPGNYTGTVNLRYGKTNQLTDEIKKLTSTTDGTLKILQDNYQDIIDDIDKKIEYEQRRLDQKERTLRLQFSRLEAVLSNYNGIQSQLNSQINQLSNATGK